jgi:hypothetical protein
MEEKAKRVAEGGRAGGFNERQEVGPRKEVGNEKTGGVDDFGRRVSDPGQDASSKRSRAEAALERLRQKANSGAKGSGARDRGRSRSRGGGRR